MSSRSGGKVGRDKDVTADLDRLIEEAAASDPAFASGATAVDDRLDLLQELARLRRRKKLSQTQVAKMMGTTQSAISELEKGIVEPRLSTLQRFAQILGHRLRLVLIKEPAPSYDNRKVRYRTPQVRVVNRHGTAVTPLDGDLSASDAVTASLDNVTAVDFHASRASRLTGSLARRIKATGTV